MPFTIRGAVRQKKIFSGKQVRVVAPDGELECRGKVLDADGNAIVLELFAPEAYLIDKLRQQKELTVTFVVPDDAAYSLKAEVSDYAKVGHLLTLQQAAPMERTEQRSDVRLKTSKLIYVARRPVGNIATVDWQLASLLDLSRGGASILTTLMAQIDEELNVWIPLEEVDHMIEAGIRVVRVVEGEDGMKTLGACFTGLSLWDQEKILDYILKVWTEKKDEKQAK